MSFERLLGIEKKEKVLPKKITPTKKGITKPKKKVTNRDTLLRETFEYLEKWILIGSYNKREYFQRHKTNPREVRNQLLFAKNHLAELTGKEIQSLFLP